LVAPELVVAPELELPWEVPPVEDVLDAVAVAEELPFELLEVPMDEGLT
jgi:hypothetical protein